ncbi:hypothetical protein BOC40_08780 [Burkholderia pseudomallei]|uniref:hypothetical protein n=1 Tax=Burkholderia pseudomallei TaxID=28450 RepID=UPI000A1A2E20|nr:hypothetical protein [Burkholderia pseudomallei]ARK82766.1 hypothetical protein BOC40_08780 [Burkholderia pseudomallei]ARL48382.1 hypothetical protein BOC50_23115 [Burkholderia pseudomallei]
MKTRWAYIWEYGFAGARELLRTPIELTREEFEAWIDEDPRACGLVHTSPLEHTKIDRNRVPLRDARIRCKTAMPEFDAPNTAELRAMWRTHTDPEVRCLILEIVMLRKSLDEIKTWFDSVDKELTDKGPFGGPQGHFQKLRHLLRREMQRAGMMR